MITKDDEVILLAKLGDESALDSVLLKYKQLVSSIARKYYLAGGDEEDLMQEGMLGLYKAIVSFDISKNIPFVAYAKTIIERQIFTAIKKAHSPKFGALNDRAVLDNQGGICGEDGVMGLPSVELSPEENMLRDAEYKDLQDKIRPTLSDFENKVFDLYVQGYNYISIASVLGETNKKIDNALTRIKVKVKNIVTGEVL